MNWQTYHQESERLAANAEIAARCGYGENALHLYAKAADAETQALLVVDPGKTRTYAITAVSAASLHYKAGQHGCAHLVAKEARRHSELPRFARLQLDELDDMMAFDESNSSSADSR